MKTNTASEHLLDSNAFQSSIATLWIFEENEGNTHTHIHTTSVLAPPERKVLALCLPPNDPGRWHWLPLVPSGIESDAYLMPCQLVFNFGHGFLTSWDLNASINISKCRPSNSSQHWTWSGRHGKTRPVSRKDLRIYLPPSLKKSIWSGDSCALMRLTILTFVSLSSIWDLPIFQVKTSNLVLQVTSQRILRFVQGITKQLTNPEDSAAHPFCGIRMIFEYIWYICIVVVCCKNVSSNFALGLMKLRAIAECPASHLWERTV